ncbi:MAG: prolyl oligopeptidase family serine peptidase [Blastocatellia bacterium]
MRRLRSGQTLSAHCQHSRCPSGVWTQAFPGSWSNYAHVWAGKGWAVFLPNVRGSSGYGEKFLLANLKGWGGGDYQDIQTGLG